MADREEAELLAHQIKQANSAKALDEARAEYIRLMEQDDWELTERALKDAIPILKAIGIRQPTQCEVAKKILELLKSNHPIKAIGMGEPQGVNGIAHVMKGGNPKDLYIKINIDRKLVRVLSFHQ